jgi:predicted DNA-binding transcriptional regulator AlpA
MTAPPRRKRGPARGSHHLDAFADLLLADKIADGPDDAVLTTKEVAMWLRVSVQTLESMRLKHTGPRYVKTSPKGVGYRRGDVKRWLRGRTHQGTAEYAKQKRSKA